MNPKCTESTSSPSLTSPERSRLRSRLELGLLKLEQLASIAIDAPLTESLLSDKGSPEPRVLPNWDGHRSDSQQDVAAERRRFPRRAGHCRVVVGRWAKDEKDKTLQKMEWRLHASPLQGDLANLSLDGAALILPHELPKDETIVVRLHCPRRDATLDRHAQVVDNLPDTMGRCRVLCRFASRLSLDQAAYFRRFLDEPRWI